MKNEQLKALVLLLAKNINPRPYLDEIELRYGRTAKYVVMTLVIGLGVILFGFSFDNVLHWLQP